MDSTSLAHPKIVHKNPPSTRHRVVDGRFAALLEEDFGISWAAVLEALQGEPQKRAIAICAWASEKTDDPAGALVAWAKKHHKGGHGWPREDRNDRRRGTAPGVHVGRPDGSLGHGVGKVRVLAGLERMGS